MYNIYPTLLDSFQRYLNDPESEVQEMINKINRVPFVSEAADKGTAFNEVVDQFLRDRLLFEGFIESPLEEWVYTFTRENRKWVFSFKKSILKEFYNRLAGAVPQIYLESEIMTKYGEVKLYGYADEMKGDTIFDIKTTSRYEFPKFLHNWQHRAYLHAQVQLESHIDRFQYLVTDFNNVFTEDYTYHPRMERELISICERLIEFVEDNRDKITDKKIYGLQTQRT
jgi:hypothetical protein